MDMLCKSAPDGRNANTMEDMHALQKRARSNI